MQELDELIHQPTRLRILVLLSALAEADFTFLLNTFKLSKGNLSVHTTRLEQAGYIEIEKSFQNKLPHTAYRITDTGRQQLAAYWKSLDAIRAEGDEAMGR
ncbi:MAG: transcriptional regulator [Armatimonadota bacterium]